MKKYLAETYGNPKTMPPAGYKTALAGKKGIIVFDVAGWSNPSGHADLWDGISVVGTDYGAKASAVHFWETN